jgi:hypothetical protein
MTEVQELIRTLEDSDIHLEVVDDRLRINAPTGALTAELRQTLQDRKSELMNALRRDWEGDARKVIAALPDESLRPMLTEYFEQTVALILREINCDRQEAQRQAFGLLIFQILRQGIETQLSKEGT